MKNNRKRKTTINRKAISKHTLRFRASTGPIIKVRSLASVGGATRRAMRKSHFKTPMINEIAYAFLRSLG